MRHETQRMSSGFREAMTLACQMTLGPFVRATLSWLRQTDVWADFDLLVDKS